MKGKYSVLIVFFRAIILYFLIILSIRLMGKRQIGELQPSELVITILLSNIATLPIEDINIPMLMGVIPIFTLVCLDVLMSWLSLYSRKVRRFFSGTPKIIISDGKVDEAVMRSLRFSVDDLMESLRSVQVFDISEVQLAIVETTGKISVYQKKYAQPCTPEILGLQTQSKNPPQLIISDGEVLENALRFIGLERSQLDKILRSESAAVKDIFMMICDEDKDYTIIKKKGREKQR